eukprot:g676.t1
MQYERRGYQTAPPPPPPPPIAFSFLDTTNSRPLEELCQFDAVSSDLTVQCQNSDVDDEFTGVEDQSRRMRQNTLRSGMRSFAVPSSLHGRQFVDKMPSESIPMDARRLHALSWSFQQELADYEASTNFGGQYIWNRLPPPPPPLTIQPPNHPNFKLASKSMCEAPVNEISKPQVKSKRRGRRGGRGKRQQNAHSIDEIPNLDKSFEHELTQQMANHVSNKSAMTHNYSSLRLHVAGGGTMIILNDQELLKESPVDVGKDARSDLTATPTGVNECRKDKLTSPSPPPLCNESIQQRSRSKQGSLDLNSSHKISHPKGCGAFFPPQVLQLLQGEDLGKTDVPSMSSFERLPSFSPRVRIEEEEVAEEEGRHSSNSSTATTVPVLESNSLINLDKTTEVCQTVMKGGGGAGTGCFLRAYLQTPEQDYDEAYGDQGFTPEDTVSHMEAESGEICILKDQKKTPGSLSKDSAAEGEENALNPSITSGDLIDIVETHDFTTYTSPLHLEEALGGDLQSNKSVQEETEQKLINLQIENEELKSSVNEKENLNSQMECLMTLNCVLQSLLLIESNKSRKRMWYKDMTPTGLALDRSSNVLVSSVQTMMDKEVQVEEKRSSVSKVSASSTSNGVRGRTRSVSSLAGDDRTAGKDSGKNSPATTTTAAAVKRSGLNVEGKSKESKLQNETTKSEKGKQDDTQNKLQRQPSHTVTTAVKSNDSVPVSNKKATQNFSGETQGNSSIKKKKVKVTSTSKTRPLVKKSSTNHTSHS